MSDTTAVPDPDAPATAEGGGMTDESPSDDRHPVPWRPSFRGYLQAWWVRVRAGELGCLPIIGALVGVTGVFQAWPRTCSSSPANFTNLLLQIAGIATIAIGIVFVLLIAEIDLSVAFGAVAGSVTMVDALASRRWPVV